MFVAAKTRENTANMTGEHKFLGGNRGNLRMGIGAQNILGGTKFLPEKFVTLILPKKIFNSLFTVME